MVEDGLALQPVVFLEDWQRLLVVVDGQMRLILHVIDVSDGTVEARACIVDVSRRIAFVVFHAVNHSQRLLEDTDGLVELFAGIVHLCKASQHILTHSQTIQLVAQCQCLMTIVGCLDAVEGQVAAHQFVVGSEQISPFRRILALKCCLQRVNAGIAIVVVSPSAENCKQTDDEKLYFHNMCKVKQIISISTL